MELGNYFFAFLQWILWTSVAGEGDCQCSEHILCLHPNPSPGPQCTGHIKSGLSWKEKMSILNATNSLRSKIATGKESLGNPGPQPSAADMMEVTWDDYLGITSQRWADQCVFEHSITKCRIADDDEYFGENLAETWYSHEHMYHDDSFLKLFKGWGEEVKDFPNRLVDHYEPGSLLTSIGHYAQLVDAKTYAMGCGRTRYKQKTFLVCHYKPGVYGEMPLYTRGKPASKCPNGTIPSKYQGLCAFGRCSVLKRWCWALKRSQYSCHEEEESGGSKPSQSAILIPSLFTLIAVANKILQFPAHTHY